MIKRISALLITAAMLLVLLPASLSSAAVNFKDVEQGKWYYDAVYYTAGKNYFNGTGDGSTFDPSGNMKRGMIVTVLWRIAGKPQAKTKAAFSDVKDGRYYTEAVSWAAETEIVKGTTATTFEPDTDATRETFATLLRRFAAYMHENTSAGGDLGQFADYRKISNYAWESLAWANNYEIVGGNAVKIMPQNKATRAEVAAMIMRYDKFLEKNIAPDYRATLDGSHISYNFTYSTSGTAQGKIYFLSRAAGNIHFYWGVNDAVIPNATPFTNVVAAQKASRTAKVGYNLAIPTGATQVMACDDSGKTVAIYDIPQAQQFRHGDCKLTFAALSDLHVESTNEPEGLKAVNLKNALRQAVGYGAQLVAVSGDIGGDGRTEELAHFRSIADTFTQQNPTIPIYTVTGNHDAPALTRFEEGSLLPVWATATADSTYYTGTYTRENVDDWYDYTVDANGSTFIFLNQMRWSYGDDGDPVLTDEQFDWLDKRLKANQDHNVFLFFHSFLDETGGNVTDGSAKYMLPLSIKRADGKRLNELLCQYPNAVFFNGHSHFEFDMDALPDLNGNYVNEGFVIYENDNGATYVHVPSTGYPRSLYTSDITGVEKSQGYIVYVYDDCIVLRGTEFKEADKIGQQLSNHYYIVSTAGNFE